MSQRVHINDECIVNENPDSGPYRLHDGTTFVYSIFVHPQAEETEVLFSEEELRAMLKAIEREKSATS